VYSYIDRFCGWNALDELLKHCPGIYEEVFAFQFKTGGRVTEVLQLNVENFTIDKPQECLVVSDMALEKRYKKDKATGKTFKVHAYRKPFPILLGERLTPEMQSFLLGKEGLLFPSPYKGSKKPLTRVRVYQVIREVSDNLPPKLFRELGLNRPFLDEHGQPIADQIHLWNHWFRSQRASQLKTDYGFNEGDLMEWFQWLDFKTATHYAHIGYSGLASKMLKHG
jgi:hypothetical protein